MREHWGGERHKWGRPGRRSPPGLLPGLVSAWAGSERRPANRIREQRRTGKCRSMPENLGQWVAGCGPHCPSASPNCVAGPKHSPAHTSRKGG